MNYNVFQRFVEQNVEVRAGGKSYRGILELDLRNNVVVLTPSDRYDARRFGPSVVDITAIVSVQVILPEPLESKDEDCGKDDSMIDYGDKQMVSHKDTV